MFLNCADADRVISASVARSRAGGTRMVTKPRQPSRHGTRPARTPTSPGIPGNHPRDQEGHDATMVNLQSAVQAAPDQPRELACLHGSGESGPEIGAKPLQPAMRRLLLTAAVLVFLAGLQLSVFTGRTGTFFAWTVANPLAAAFLGAAYWASIAIEVLAGRQRLWANARIAVPAVFVFTVLTLSATLMHLSQLHLGSRYAAGTRIVAVAWLAIYIIVPVLLLIILAAQARGRGADPPPSAGLPAWICVIVAVQAVVLLGLGVALFAAPQQTAPIWPWKLTPFLAQATGAWLISLGVAAVHALLERDPRRLRPAAVGYVLLAPLMAIALARYPHYFRWQSVAGIVYLVFLATMPLTGLAALARGRHTRARDGRWHAKSES
jgi:hypothetical protein